MSQDYTIHKKGSFSCAAVEECVILQGMLQTSIYYHIPFCTKRCGYCDFNTFAGLSRFIPAYVEALCREIRQVSKDAPRDQQIHTLFFGGGTPSLLRPQQIEEILKTTRSVFEVRDDAEITMEANPGTVTSTRIQQYVAAGVNRFSFGMQSAHPDDLRILDRTHDFKDVLDAVQACRQAGIQQVNVDLIFGIPGQTMERWQSSLQRAVDMGVDHLSLYALTVEEGTPLNSWINKGLLDLPDDDLAADMYEWAADFLAKQGFLQYEISNWSRGEDARCRHNLQYWEYKPYYGFGAGAHGFIEGKRTENVGLIGEYITRMRQGNANKPPASSAAKTVTTLSIWDQMQELMMVGLRLTDAGVSVTRFGERYDVGMEQVFAKQVDRLLGEGLVEIVEKPEKCIRLTSKGRLLGNQVFVEFVGNKEPEMLKMISR
jgi:oxygen-independent coproporphyrinogen-3 oxidase